MDRKKTILIAIFINAGLIAILFIAALTTEQEISPKSEMVENELPQPLFQEPIDLPVKENHPVVSAPVAETPLVQLPPAAAPSKAEEPVAHKLPPLAEEASPKQVALRSEAPYVEIVVKKGDTLEKIAKAHQTTVDEIIKLNQLPSSFLRIGQILKIPVVKTFVSAPKLKPAPPAEKTAGPEYYTVKVGDNPWTIAMKHHMKVEELLRLNGLNEERARKLKPGDRLRIR